MEKDFSSLFNIYHEDKFDWIKMYDDPEIKHHCWFFDKNNPKVLKARIGWLKSDHSGAESLITWLNRNDILVDKITHEYICWTLTTEQATALKLTFE